MNQKKYTCDYCSEEYIPQRRGVQRFCSSKCRKKYSYHKNKIKVELTTNPTEQKSEFSEPSDPNKMTVGGVKDAFVANALYDGAKTLGKFIFTPAKNKTVLPKPDQISFSQKTKLIKIKNFPKRSDGSIAYFDTETEQIVYVPDPNYHNPAANVI